MPRTLCVVIDTRSLVSYALTRGDLMRQVVAHWRQRLRRLRSVVSD